MEELPQSRGYPDDELIRSVLEETRSIAVVGASPKPWRPSHGVLRFLLAAGYHAIPVNPGHAGKEIAGQLVYARLADIPVPIDMVDVFRRSDAVARNRRRSSGYEAAAEHDLDPARNHQSRGNGAG